MCMEGEWDWWILFLLFIQGVQGEEGKKKKALTWGMPTPYYFLLSTCGKLEGNNVGDQKLVKVEG